VLGYPQERFGLQDEKASFVTDNVIFNFHNQSWLLLQESYPVLPPRHFTAF
jgi:hypothetical protein